MAKRSIAIAAAMALCCAGFMGLAAARTGAPSFSLRTLDGTSAVESSALFDAYAHVFLVFWSPSCPLCVEALRGADAFSRRHGGPDIAVAGVAAGDGDALALREMLETSGVSFPQLRDAGGIVSGAYGVPFETFVIVHVAAGAIAGSRRDPSGDIAVVMEEMLLRDAAPDDSSDGAARDGEAAAEGGGGSSVDGSSDAVVRGANRIRILTIDSRGEDASGLYGEPIRPGTRLDYRIEVEASKRIARYLRAGGLLRISNEGERVLESGPKYLGSPWGSAFAEIEAGALAMRIGYYSIYLTPLTLMRWDWDDNPRIGGNAGCGCGASAGVLLVESLDDLAPELTFEGALASYAVPGGELRAFYAMPHRARETSYGAYWLGIEERARYSLEIYGAEWRWQRALSHIGGSWKIGARYVGSREDPHSVDFAELGYLASDGWRESGVATVSADLSFASLRARAEGVVWNRTTEYGRGEAGDTIISRADGRGGLLGVAASGPRGWTAAVDYLLLDPGFYSPFAALSYESNWKGFRVSAHAPLFRSKADADLFYKRLLEHTPNFGAERAETEIAGVSIASEFGGGFTAAVGWIEERTERQGVVFPYTRSRRAFEAGFDRRFAKSAIVELRYDRVRNEETSALTSSRTTVDLYTLSSKIFF